MQIEVSALLQGLLLLSTLVAGGWGIIRYLDTRIEASKSAASQQLEAAKLLFDQRMTLLEGKVDQRVTRLEAKTDQMRDAFASKDDIHRIERTLNQLRTDLMELIGKIVKP